MRRIISWKCEKIFVEKHKLYYLLFVPFCGIFFLRDKNWRFFCRSHAKIVCIIFFSNILISTEQFLEGIAIFLQTYLKIYLGYPPRALLTYSLCSHSISLQRANYALCECAITFSTLFILHFRTARDILNKDPLRPNTILNLCFR